MPEHAINDDITEVAKLVAMFRLDSMTSLEIIIGHDEKINFDKFQILFHSLVGDVHTGRISYSPKKNIKKYNYKNNCISIYELQKPTITKKSTLIAAIAINRSSKPCILKYVQHENKPCHVFNNMSPTSVEISEQWQFTLEDRYEYLLIKAASGSSTQNACENGVEFSTKVSLLYNKMYINTKTNAEIASSLLEKAADIVTRMSGGNLCLDKASKETRA